MCKVDKNVNKNIELIYSKTSRPAQLHSRYRVKKIVSLRFFKARFGVNNFNHNPRHEPANPARPATYYSLPLSAPSLIPTRIQIVQGCPLVSWLMDYAGEAPSN